MDAYLAVDRNAVYVDPSDEGCVRAAVLQTPGEAPEYREHPDPVHGRGHHASSG